MGSNDQASGDTSADALQGRRILVVEDELLVALDAKTIIQGYGGTVVGPFPRIPAALEAVYREAIDGAILDVNVAGTPSFAAADALRERNIPFVFCTGYGREIVPPRFRDIAIADKPFVKQSLLSALLAAFEAREAQRKDEPAVPK